MKRILLTLLFFTSVNTLFAQTETEPNNTYAQANTISLGSTTTGSISPSGDADFYQVCTNRCGVLIVNLTNVPANQQLQIRLYSAPNVDSLIGSTGGSAGGNANLESNVSSGCYYIKIYDYYNTANTSSYTMAVAFDTTDACECNNNFASACAIPANTSFLAKIRGVNLLQTPSTDNDYYEVCVSRCGVLIVNLTNVPVPQQLQLKVYSAPNVDSLIGTSGGSSGGNVTVESNVAAGCYYIRVYDYYNTTSAQPYTMAVAFDTTDACECNNNFASACVIRPNTSLLAKIRGTNALQNPSADNDYYEVCVTRCGTLTTSLTNVPVPQQLQLRIYSSPNIDSLIGNTGGSSGGNATLHSDVKPGCYYIRVYDYYGTGSSSPYTMAVAFHDRLSTPSITPSGPLTECQGSVLTLHSDASGNNHWSNGQVSQTVLDTITSAGYITLLADSGGCFSGVDSVLILINSAPTASFTAPVSGNSISFVNNSSGATSYQWYFGDGNSSSQFTTTHTYTTNGTYTATLIAYNNCGQDTARQTFTIVSNGINALSDGMNVTLYPDPVMNVLNIQSDDVHPDMITIYELGGKKISDQKYASQIDVSSLCAGSYYVEVKSGTKTARLRFVKL